MAETFSASPTMLPPPSPHRVHFENTCVVIPEIEENSVLHFEKRSYTLPSWRRLRPEDATHDQPPPIINIRLPSLSRKHRRMPSAERGTPLQPCLRHSHSLSCSNSENLATTSTSTIGSSSSHLPPSPSAPTHPHRHSRTATRRASLNSSTTEDRIPLRECCKACIESVDKGLQQDYHEHWSKGAQRRRRMSESDNPSSSCSSSSAFLKKTVKVDEVDSKKPKRPFNVPAKLSPALLEHLCADEDESMLFPLPSPRRTGTPTCGTPQALSPSATPPRGSPSPRRTPSPNSVAQALARTRIDSSSIMKPLPSPPPSPAPLSGKDLLAQYPDVDALPSRRAASEGSPSTVSRKTSHLLSTPAPRMFGW
ncbi:hypothetical protein FRB91_001684 [Serendipita sp. 411]|nr:hypothetical protein FRB91_001684 [Serendipita sp. 411]